MGRPDSPVQEHVLRGLLLSHNEEDRLRPLFLYACLPNNCPPLHTPCLHCVADLHLSRDYHDKADSWDVGKRGASGPGRHVGGRARVMLMEGTYIGSISGEILISDGGQIAKADDPVCAQSP